MVKEDFTAKVVELRPEGNVEGESCANIWEEEHSGQKEEKHKGFEEGACLAYSRDNREARVAGAETGERSCGQR